MKVRYLQGMGESKGPGILPGEVRDVSEEEAERLIAKDIAVADDGSEASPADLPEPFSGYADAKAKEIIEKVNDDELSLGELVALRGAEKAGEGRSTVLEAVEAKLAPAEEALSPPSPVDVPSEVTPGETPGWPVDETGEVLQLPDQVREELAEAHQTIESKEAELTEANERAETAATRASETATSAKAEGAQTATPKPGAKTTKSKKAASAKKRKG